MRGGEETRKREGMGGRGGEGRGGGSESGTGRGEANGRGDSYTLHIVYIVDIVCRISHIFASLLHLAVPHLTPEGRATAVRTML